MLKYVQNVVLKLFTPSLFCEPYRGKFFGKNLKLLTLAIRFYERYISITVGRG